MNVRQTAARHHSPWIKTIGAANFGLSAAIDSIVMSPIRRCMIAEKEKAFRIRKAFSMSPMAQA